MTDAHTRELTEASERETALKQQIIAMEKHITEQHSELQTALNALTSLRSDMEALRGEVSLFISHRFSFLDFSLSFRSGPYI